MTDEHFKHESELPGAETAQEARPRACMERCLRADGDGSQPAYAASLIVNHLQPGRPAEFEIGDEEIATIQEAVRQVRNQVKR